MAEWRIPACAAIAWLAGLALAAAAPAGTEDLAPLPERARPIIETRCAGCRDTYAVDGVLDLDALAADPEWVRPGRPDASRVYQRLLASQSSARPKDGAPSSADVETVRDWIASLPRRDTACEGRERVSAPVAERRIGRWMETVGAVEASDTQVLSLLHLWNSCATAEELKTAREAVSVLFSALARRTTPVAFQTIGEESALIAVRLSDIALLPAEWTRLTENAPTINALGAVPADWLAARILSRPTDTSGKPDQAFDVTFSKEGERAVSRLARSWERNVDIIRASGERAVTPRKLKRILYEVGDEFLLPARRLAHASITREAWTKLSLALDSEAKPGSAIEIPLPATDEIDVVIWTDEPFYRPRDLLTINATVGKACYLTLIDVDREGKAIVLYPNELEQDNLVAPGVMIQVPGNGADYQLRFDRSGSEDLIAICQRKQVRPDGITYDYERQRFDYLGDWKTFLRKAPELEKEIHERQAYRESRRNRRRGKDPEPENKAIGADDPIAMEGRAAITVTIDPGGSSHPD